MKNLEVAGFVAHGSYTAFNELYSQFAHVNPEITLILSDAGNEQCTANSSFTEFLGYMATAFNDAPNVVIASKQLQSDWCLDVLKWTPTLTRSWVLHHQSNDIVIKISGDQEENRIQFSFLNHLYERMESANTSVSVPAQYALLQTGRGFSAICMEYVEGELLTTLEPAERQRQFDTTLHTVDSLLDPKYHALINDIGCRGQNGHYNNMIISPEGVAILFDLPNMSSLDEKNAVRAILAR